MTGRLSCDLVTLSSCHLVTESGTTTIMAILLTLQGPETGHRYPLQGAITVLGRQADATVCLAAKAVSRHHAQVVQADGEYFLEDLDSSNGTFLNGTRLSPRVRVRLTEHDTVQIGPYVFGLRLS